MIYAKFDWNWPAGSGEDVCLFVCLFIAAWAIFQLSGGCHHYRWQGCKLRPMLGAQGLWARRESLSCHTYCDTGPRFIWSHLKDRHPHPTVGFEPLTQGSSDHWARHSNHCTTRATFVNIQCINVVWYIVSTSSRHCVPFFPVYIDHIIDVLMLYNIDST